jgi:glucoamylase
LSTLAVSEQLCDWLIVWNKQGSLNVTSLSLPFFRLFSPSITIGSYSSSSSTFKSLVASIKSYADGFVAVVAQRTPSNGGLAEQFNRNDGTPLSAVDLTWSYASALTAFDARKGVTASTWGAGSSSLQLYGTASVKTVPDTFNITMVFGEKIYLTGLVDGLMDWNTESTLSMDTANYPIWSCMSFLSPSITSERFD